MESSSPAYTTHNSRPASTTVRPCLKIFSSADFVSHQTSKSSLKHNVPQTFLQHTEVTANLQLIICKENENYRKTFVTVSVTIRLQQEIFKYVSSL